MATVWANQSSGLLFCPGSRYYGKTKIGFYGDGAQLLGQVWKKNRQWRPSNKGGKCMGVI